MHQSSAENRPWETRGQGWARRAPALQRPAHCGAGADPCPGQLMHSSGVVCTITLLAGANTDQQQGAGVELAPPGSPSAGTSAPIATRQDKLQQLRQLQQHGMWQHHRTASGGISGGTLSMSERVRRFREGPPKSRQQRAQHAQHALHAQHGQRFQHEIGSPEPLRCSDGSSEDSIQLELEQSADALLRAAQRALQHCSSGSSHSGTAAAMDPGSRRATVLAAAGGPPAAAGSVHAVARGLGGCRLSPVGAAHPGDDDILESWRRRRALQQALGGDISAVQVLTPCTGYAPHAPASTIELGAAGTLHLSSLPHGLQPAGAWNAVHPSNNSPKIASVASPAGRAAAIAVRVVPQAIADQAGPNASPKAEPKTRTEATPKAIPKLNSKVEPEADPEADPKADQATLQSEGSWPCTSAADSVGIPLTEWRRWLPDPDVPPRPPLGSSYGLASPEQVSMGTAAPHGEASASPEQVLMVTAASINASMNIMESGPASNSKSGAFTTLLDRSRSPLSRGPSLHSSPAPSPGRDGTAMGLESPQWSLSPTKAPSLVRSAARSDAGRGQWQTSSVPGASTESRQQSSPAGVMLDTDLKISAATWDADSCDSRGMVLPILQADPVGGTGGHNRRASALAVYTAATDRPALSCRVSSTGSSRNAWSPGLSDMLECAVGSVLFGVHAASGVPPPDATGREQSERVGRGENTDPASSSDDRSLHCIFDVPLSCGDAVNCPRRDDERDSSADHGPASGLSACMPAACLPAHGPACELLGLPVDQRGEFNEEIGSSVEPLATQSHSNPCSRSGEQSAVASVGDICGSRQRGHSSTESICDIQGASAAVGDLQGIGSGGLIQASREHGSAGGTESVAGQLRFSLECDGEDGSLLLLLREALSSGPPAQQDPTLGELYSLLKGP